MTVKGLLSLQLSEPVLLIVQGGHTCWCVGLVRRGLGGASSSETVIEWWRISMSESESTRSMTSGLLAGCLPICG
jgi:hypothetical protein